MLLPRYAARALAVHLPWLHALRVVVSPPQLYREQHMKDLQANARFSVLQERARLVRAAMADGCSFAWIVRSQNSQEAWGILTWKGKADAEPTLLRGATRTDWTTLSTPLENGTPMPHLVNGALGKSSS